MSVKRLMRAHAAPVCPFCGAERPDEPCKECERSHGSIEWTAEPRGWSPTRRVLEIVLVVLGTTLFVLPLVHGIGAVLIFIGSWKSLDGGVARAFVGGISVLTAAVEVSLIRGLTERIALRWSRRWSFRTATTNGSGWVQMARRKPLAGWGSIRENGVLYRWFADYARGQRTRSSDVRPIQDQGANRNVESTLA
jgi:hypothetical protein